MKINYNQVLGKAKKHNPSISKFLRDIIAIPSESSHEEKVIKRIKQEMHTVGFDRVEIDPIGNILGYMGKGKHLIAMDAHIDTVGIGDRNLWQYDPYEGFEDDEIIIGRGASDQKGGMASIIYGAKIIKDLDLAGDYTLLATGTVQEEDCDGLCWQYIIEEDKIKPEFVVSTEPTSCRIHRGQRGRMEIHVSFRGVSSHGSAPDRGENAIYMASKAALEIEKLNERLANDKFLGKGTVTISEFKSESPSLCAVSDFARIHLDRRLTWSEDKELALNQVREIVKDINATVELLDYEETAISILPLWPL